MQSLVIGYFLSGRQVSYQQEKIQATDVVEFASTPGGGCSYKKDLFWLPIVFTVNSTTRNLQHLQERDFLSTRDNVRVLSFSGRPGEAPPRDTLPPRT